MSMMKATNRAARASDAQRNATKRREGRFDANGVSRPSLRAFQDPGDPVTIGWGHTLPIEINGETRKPRLGDQITAEYADKLFDQFAAPMAEERIDRFFPDIPLTQNQRDALFDFCYNISLRTLTAAKFTLGDLIRSNQTSKDLMLEWFPKYRNPRTVFEQGLYRRRIWNACVFLGCDVVISERLAWDAELRRGPNNEISFATDPQLIYYRALTETEKQAKPKPIQDPVIEPPEPIAEPESPRPVAAPSDTPHPSDDAPSPPVGVATKPKPPSETKPVRRRLPPSPQAPRADPDEIQLTRPEFWSLQLLVFGRVALAFGLLPAAFSDLILDPAFQSAIGGSAAIYIAMFMRARAEKQAERKRAKRVLERADDV